MRIILFDIDGTLLLTGGAGLDALSCAFRDLYGVDGAAAGVEFHGRTDPLILHSIAERHLARTLSAAELDAIVARYLEHLPRTLAERPFRILPGVTDLLEALSARGDVVLGLATGNFEPAAWSKLRRGGLDGYFSFGGFGSDHADRAELTRLAVSRGRRIAGDGASALVVGDTVHDVRCAHAAGAACLAVATGNASRDVLSDAGAEWAVETLADPVVRDALGLADRTADGGRRRG
jgi:phosphoglycolate phosphatase-like HAD superfamily hydrolase